MVNKFYFKALDKSLRGILWSKDANNHTKPFGGLIVVLGKDFRQILPVIPKGRRGNIIDATSTFTYLWPEFKVLTLKRNMRLTMNKKNNESNGMLSDFDHWLLAIGNGDLKLANQSSTSRISLQIMQLGTMRH